jgi:DNA-binding transcriptional ArsR family regulator
MPSRLIVSRELADLFRLLAHADRLRLIEDLRGGEKDVTGIAQSLDLPTTRISQHLALLRAARLVEERRDGRSHFYRLAHPLLAGWVLDALPFIDIRQRLEGVDHIETARALWGVPDPNSL